MNSEASGIRRWLILIVGSFSILLTMGFGYFALPVFYKGLITDYGWDRASLMLGPSTGLLLYTILSPLIGKAVDRFSPKITLIFGATLFAAGFLLLSRTHSLPAFIFSNTLVGIGMACSSYMPVQVLVSHWFRDRKSFAIGLTTVGGSAGSALAPLVANAMLVRLGRQGAFAAIALLIAVVLIPCLLLVVRNAPHTSEKPSRSYRVTEQGSSSRRPGFLVVVGTGFGALMFSVTIILQHLIIYLGDLHIPQQRAAQLLTLALIAGVCGRFLAGYLGDFFAKERLVIAAVGILSVSPAALFLPSSILVLVAFAIVFGFGYGAVASSMPVLVVSAYQERAIGFPLGIFYAFGSLGGSVGPVVAGKIFDVTGAYRTAFSLLWALMLFTLIAFSVFFFARPIRCRSVANS